MKKIGYIGYRPTWAEINLENLEYNFRQVKKMILPSVKVMATVKADAYGHGLIPVASRLSSCGVDYLGVASIDEGIHLRKAKLNLPVLVLGMALKKDIGPLFKYNLAVTVCDMDLALALNNKSRAVGRPARVHIKVDTGMGRLGVSHQDARSFVEEISRLKYIKIDGIFTHFAFADMDRDFTLAQIDSFVRLIGQLKKIGITPPFIHAANSMGIIGYKEGHFNMVRPGLVIYGLHSAEGVRIKLKPVLSLKTKVIYLKRMSKGSGISYGHIYITKENTTVVVLPIGYGDGYPRNLSNLAPVLIGGRTFRVSGRVCMDQMMVDVGPLAAKIGDEAVLIGSQGKNKVGAEELARLSGTICYEIVCGLGNRIPRVYID